MDYFHSIQDFRPQKGDLLISEPYLPDPNFERTVVLICEHDENGTFGYVLNQESQVVFSDLVEDIYDFDEKVFVGGPVQQDTLHFVHRSNDSEIGGQEVVKNVNWGGNYESLLDIIRTQTIDPKDFRFFVGYSGWGASQLEDELEAKSWFVYKNTTEKLIFDTEPEILWQTVLESLGGKFRMMSKYPTDPRMN